jgi:hypothetical protein
MCVTDAHVATPRFFWTELAVSILHHTRRAVVDSLLIAIIIIEPAGSPPSPGYSVTEWDETTVVRLYFLVTSLLKLLIMIRHSS